MKHTLPKLRRNLQKLLLRIPKLKVAVVGDLIVDEYVYGQTTRVSREAPVLILRYKNSRATLGGAANTASNAASLKASVWPVGIVGKDAAGDSILSLMKRAGMDTSFVQRSSQYATICKTRILAGGANTSVQQVIRMDREPEGALPPVLERNVLSSLEKLRKKVDLFILSDYGYGVLGEASVAKLNQWAREGACRAYVDAQKDLLRFRQMCAITPNEPEVEEALHIPLATDDDVALAGRMLIEKAGHECVVITRGRKGMAVVEKDKDARFLGIYGTDEVADVTGAGDTVVTTLALGQTAGGSWVESATLANIAAGIVVTKSGTVPITFQELSAALAPRAG